MGIAKLAHSRNVHPSRRRNDHGDGDIVVIRYSNSGFVVVECEDTAIAKVFFSNVRVQEAYSGGVRALFNVLALPAFIGALMAVRNSALLMQLVFGLSHVLMYALLSAVEALPDKMHWSRSHSMVTTSGRCQENIFPNALNKCIMITRSVEWIVRTRAASDTDAWKDWLEEALQAVEHEEGVFSNVEPTEEED
ncbi:gb [Venturia nashicola]|uniref:Gb n=1 Tax=Venturia nashicola TaxID=86259 RepID=A0A4Z1NSI9_9PEZI|nr:gb [Venturia nashicola]TLD29433.1 gb [Venturia nashicola]